MKQILSIIFTVLTISLYGQSFRIVVNKTRVQHVLSPSQFISYMDTIEMISLHSATITNESKTLFDFREPESVTIIKKLSDKKYHMIISSWVIAEIGYWDWEEILKFDLTVIDDKFRIAQDLTFQPLKLNSSEIDSVLNWYHELKSDPVIVNMNWDNFNKEEAGTIEELMSYLFLGAIYGDTKCKEHFRTLPQDFKTLELGNVSEIYATYLGTLNEIERN